LNKVAVVPADQFLDGVRPKPVEDVVDVGLLRNWTALRYGHTESNGQLRHDATVGCWQQPVLLVSGPLPNQIADKLSCVIISLFKYIDKLTNTFIFQNFSNHIAGASIFRQITYFPEEIY
jgi:hypothetical protein